MKKSIAILLVVLVVVSITSVCFAGCDREVTKNGKKQACGASISWVVSGQSIEKSGSHKYGGFFGLFQGTCNYKYIDIYEHYLCTAKPKNHVQDMRTTQKTYNHSSCGQN